MCYLSSLQAQQELETEGLKGEFDRSQATQALETTLDKLLDHLEDKEGQDQEQQAGVQRGSDPTRGSPSLAPKHPGNQAVLPFICTVCVSILFMFHPHVQVSCVTSSITQSRQSLSFNSFCNY